MSSPDWKSESPCSITERHFSFAREKGKEVYGVLMMSHMASKELLLTEALKMQTYGAEGIVIMDSAGAYLPADVTSRITHLVTDLNVPVGFHAHNNLGMSIANSIAAVEAGAKLLDAVDVYPKPIKDEVIGFDIRKFEHIIGAQISKENAARYFKKLGFGVQKGIRDEEWSFLVRVPAWRTDIENFEDLAVFVAATANRIDLLPAEMIRKGRFHEVFFIDLPTDDERAEIFAIHLHKRGIDPAALQLHRRKRIAQGWTGAEIEQCVVSALTAVKLQDKTISFEDLHRAAQNVIPLSKTMREQVDHIRSWAYDRAVRASPREASR